MDIRPDKESSRNEDFLDAKFYSSSSIDNLAHARNLRNSILLSESSRSLFADRSLHTEEYEEEEAPEIDIDDINKENETQTKALKITASPSLSALSGILNEKSKQAEQRMRSSMIFDTSIQEEDGEEEESSKTSNYKVISSPNLIDINDSHEYTPFQKPAVLATEKEEHEQPDFLSTPEIRTPMVDPPTPEVEPTPTNSPSPNQTQSRFTNTSHEVNSNKGTGASRQSSSHSTNRQQPETSRASLNKNSSASSQNILKKQASDGRSLSGSSTISDTVPGRNITPNKDSAKKKRRSLFSFLKRKPQKSASFVVPSQTTSQILPTSSTFSVAKQTETDDYYEPNRLTKKSYSSGSLFGNFRKNKDTGEETVDQSLVLPKQRKPLSQKLPSDSGPSTKSEIQKRKPTPLDFEQTIQKEVPSTIVPEADSELIKVEQSGENRSRIDSGEALFPKSLSAQEVESIVSLERSRSLKSNKRNSLSSHRRSLTDNISINAHNEGMFVTEASNAVISTPDWSKSPTSSILRNGAFESIDGSPSRAFVVEESDEVGETVTKDSLQDKEVSLNSLEEKMRNTTIESHPHDQTSNEKRENSTFLTDPEDSEFMSDIMEFASIIDFGEGLDLSFDSNPSELKYETLNPSSQKHAYSMHQADPVSKETFDFETSQSKGHHAKLEPEPATKPIDRNFPNNTETSFHSNYDGSFKEDLDDDDDNYDEFEGEDFNQLEDTIPSPSINGFMPASQTGIGRPLSLSFRGLRAPQFNSSTDVTPNGLQSTVLKSSSFDTNKKAVTFSSRIILYDTYNEEEYNRHPDIATCNQLTPQLAQMIKEELNSLKSEMEIHEDSRCYTHFL